MCSCAGSLIDELGKESRELYRGLTLKGKKCLASWPTVLKERCAIILCSLLLGHLRGLSRAWQEYRDQKMKSES